MRILFLMGLSVVAFHSWSQSTSESYWTFTYLKAKPEQEENLRMFIEKNWFAMDSIAVREGLISQYQLYENDSDGDWNFIVAVEYNSKDRYSSIEVSFENIRLQHNTIKIKGFGFADLGTVLKSESVTQWKPSQ